MENGQITDFLQVSDCRPDGFSSKLKQFVEGDFEFEKTLGSGGFGYVWKCNMKVQIIIGRDHVAIKLPKTSENGFLDPVSDLQHEANLHCRLEHPHIVKILGLVQMQDRYGIVMEFMDGGTLRDLLLSEHSISIDLTVHLARQFSCGLGYLHNEAKIVHADLKPENILLTENQVLKITDFGVAARGPGSMATQSVLLTSHIHGGTRNYIPPEFRAGMQANPAVDMWSCGVIFAEMIEKVPRAAISSNAGMLLNAIVDRCMHRNPNYRLSSTQVYEELQQIAALQYNQRAVQTNVENQDEIMRAYQPSAPTDSHQQSAEISSAATTQSHPQAEEMNNYQSVVPFDTHQQSAEISSAATTQSHPLAEEMTDYQSVIPRDSHQQSAEINSTPSVVSTSCLAGQMNDHQLAASNHSHQQAAKMNGHQPAALSNVSQQDAEINTFRRAAPTHSHQQVSNMNPLQPTESIIFNQQAGKRNGHLPVHTHVQATNSNTDQIPASINVNQQATEMTSYPPAAPTHSHQQVSNMNPLQPTESIIFNQQAGKRNGHLPVHTHVQATNSNADQQRASINVNQQATEMTSYPPAAPTHSHQQVSNTNTYRKASPMNDVQRNTRLQTVQIDSRANIIYRDSDLHVLRRNAHQQAEKMEAFARSSRVNAHQQASQARFVEMRAQQQAAKMQAKANQMNTQAKANQMNIHRQFEKMKLHH